MPVTIVYLSQVPRPGVYINIEPLPKPVFEFKLTNEYVTKAFQQLLDSINPFTDNYIKAVHELNNLIYWFYDACRQRETFFDQIPNERFISNTKHFIYLHGRNPYTRYFVIQIQFPDGTRKDLKSIVI